ncbi:Reticulon-like protein [Rhynchospora pubera]|uniref:Reticulon-like protein n=1 Tax=Rhynchospora pubera TaxID=906938 RepID=A0AAV8D6J0_9POAL|nr:Reticulon-like protein [Rhynchospora pubera]
MSENEAHTLLVDKITEKFHDYSSSSDSDGEVPSNVLRIKKHLFGRTESVHNVLGGGKAADLVLWRNKLVSGAIFSGVTVIWLLFEWIGYHLIAFLCHFLILVLAVSFVWSNAASLINRSPPKFPEVILSEDIFLQMAQSIRHEINEAFITFCYIASGKDALAFVKVIAGLWLLSVVGSWFSFLTLSYIAFVLAHTVPVICEAYQDPIDSTWYKFMDQSKSHLTKNSVAIKEAIKKIPHHPKQE